MDLRRRERGIEPGKSAGTAQRGRVAVDHGEPAVPARVLDDVTDLDARQARLQDGADRQSRKPLPDREGRQVPRG